MSFRTPPLVARALTRRCLHRTSVRRAITNLGMPAMSPTMTEGGIASWKKKEGESFTAGEVLLEVETDKATIDVEAQEDGVLAKILASDGTKNVAVGRVIALLAEEGDDLSNLEAPKEEPKAAAPQPSTTTPPPSLSAPEPVQEPKIHSHHPTHSKHLMPSVIRLLVEGGVTDAEVIKGTGVRGMLTKGDVLAYLGRASNPLGTYKPPQKETLAPSKAEPPAKPLDGDATRRLIVSGLAAKSKPAPHAPSTPASFDSIIADYSPPARPSTTPAPPTLKDNILTHFNGLL